MSGFQAEAKTELEPWARDALAQQDAARAPARAPAIGAPPQMSEADSLLLVMETLEPGDFKHVANLIERHPALRDMIVAKAQEVCGNDTVAKALELLSKPTSAATTAASTTASPTAAPDTPAKSVEVVTGAKQGGKQSPDDFVYIVSFLALEYDRSEKIRDHVDFIRKNPQLRDKVLAGAAELDAPLAADVEKALRGEAAPRPEAASAQAPASDQADAPAAKPAEKKFEYILSPLALEYNRDEKIKDHVDFILEHPELRDQVLIGAAEFDAPLAEEVRVRLLNPAPAPAVTESEPTPPDAVLKTAEKAAPPPEKKHAKPKADAAASTTQDKPEAGWVVRARAYNEKHWDTVNAFLQITGGACLGANGTVDPHLVAQWQAAHGTPPDGRIGEGTVAAAILDSPLDADVAVEPEPAPAANPGDSGKTA